MDPELILMALSGGFMIFGAIRLRNGNYLASHGKKADAIIFKNNFNHSGSDGGVYYPVVRFLTDKQEWITQELSTGYQPPMSEGTKVEVLYDPDNPTDVEINSPLQLKILPRVFLVIGVAGMILSILEYTGVIAIL